MREHKIKKKLWYLYLYIILKLSATLHEMIIIKTYAPEAKLMLKFSAVSLE